MSSISIVQEHNRFTFFVDTAVSIIIGGKLYRVRNSEAQKIHIVGKDVVFMSGGEREINLTLHKMHELIDYKGNIIISSLQAYLQTEYPGALNPDKKFCQIGVAILAIVDGKTMLIGMSQGLNGVNDFQINICDAPEKGIITLAVDGIENNFIRKKIMENNKFRYERTGRYDIIADIWDTYRNYYSEGIGSEIFMYSFDNSGVSLLRSEKLNEYGLKYADEIIDKQEVYIDGRNSGGYAVITQGNIGSQSVNHASSASSTTNARYLVNDSGRNCYVSAYDNFIPSTGGMYVGSSSNYWAGAYLGSGPVVTSDKDKKHDIDSLNDKYLEFAKKIIPRTFKYNDGTSGRTHIGFIAQEIEDAMTECGISDLEFAGLIKSPRYAKKLQDEEGNELDEYDASSEIIGYDYALRYDEFIPLILAWIIDQEERLTK